MVRVRRNSPQRKRKASRLLRTWADSQVASIAKECSDQALKIEEPIRLVRIKAAGTETDPPEVGTDLRIGTEEDARQALEGLLRDAIVSRHLGAAHVIRVILDSKEPVLGSRVTKVANTRHWAIWLMMNRLLEWSEFDPTTACDATQAAKCRKLSREDGRDVGFGPVSA